ncbi:hypothetical protein M407DRAFT_68356 [Tulasnella calospora MUT 4182]|uniref:Mitochondrial adapter protein MCP1 transmembrane domain-containing protein n=1 Tax=Tulasnella calospora MUT 4182 TaxID=1051891 RepID=A0A0C3QR68_9AGAM|nr:hypothetical protein M407DRAFT_68356 [Tulasnella calospora MUT 4182]
MSRRTKAIWALTIIQHGTASFISVFALIHLSAPILATFGGSELASQTMLLGREFYQGTLSEPLLVLGPLGIHVTASAVKRFLIGFPSPPSLLTWATIPILSTLPIHFATHRLYPSIPDPPINALSPGELDYEYVKFGLQAWPWRNTLLYLVLVAGTATHALEGARAMIRFWQPGAAPPKEWGWKRWSTVAAVVGSAAVGILTLKGETLIVTSRAASRISSAWKHSILYRL